MKMFVKVEFIEENLTYMMPNDLTQITFDDVNQFIKEKVKNVTYTISFSQADNFEVLNNQSEFDKVKAEAINRNQKFFKLFISTQIQPIDESQKHKQEEQKANRPHQEPKQYDEHHNEPVQNKELSVLKCSHCSEVIPDNQVRHECYFCKNMIFCIVCEESNIHIVHPLIKIKHFKHLEQMKQRQQNIVHNFVHNVICKFTGNEKKDQQDQQQVQNKQGLAKSFLGKLFQFTNLSQNQEEEQVDQVFLRASKIAEILQSDPERLQKFIEQHQELNDEQLVEEIIKNPQQFNLGL